MYNKKDDLGFMPLMQHQEKSEEEEKDYFEYFKR